MTEPACPAGRPEPVTPVAGAPLAVEPTAIGPQSLVPGVPPITARDRLEWRAAAPLEPRKPQRPCDHGLFDLNARLQLDLFAALSSPAARLDRAAPAAAPSQLPPPQPPD